MKNLLLLAAMFLFPAFASAQTPSKKEEIPQYLQDVSVTIKSGDSQGSGVLICRNKEAYVLTAAHVVENLRKTRTKIVDGVEKKVVYFESPKIVKYFIENGRTVGHIQVETEVVRYSDAEYGDDIALLHILKKDFSDKYIVFYNDPQDRPLGTPLVHVGSLLGEAGSNSYTKGILSSYGRMIKNKEYIQTSVIAQPGSSGGGIFLEENAIYIGMLTRGSGDANNLVVPYSRIKAWARKVKVEWLFDTSVTVPSIDEIKKVSIED